MYYIVIIIIIIIIVIIVTHNSTSMWQFNADDGIKSIINHQTHQKIIKLLAILIHSLIITGSCCEIIV